MVLRDDSGLATLEIAVALYCIIPLHKYIRSVIFSLAPRGLIDRLSGKIERTRTMLVGFGLAVARRILGAETGLRPVMELYGQHLSAVSVWR